MNKSQAIQIINNISREFQLSYSNTSFASINKAKNVWWINPSQKKITDGSYFILKEDSELILLKIPAYSLVNLNDKFRIRKDNGRVDLELSSDRANAYLCDLKSGGKGK